MVAFGRGLPFWTPFFLLCLLILASVWGMPLVLNKQALEDLFKKDPEPENQCPNELNPAVKAFLSWPNYQTNEDKAVAEKETNADQLFDQQGLLNNPVEEPLNSQNLELGSENLKLNSQNLELGSENLKLNSQNLELQAASGMESKEEAVADQKKELKALEGGNNGNKGVRQTPDHEMLGKVKGSKSKLINPGIMDYKREFASDEANPYVESLAQR